MIRSHTKKLICSIPETLKNHVVSVIVGESDPGVHEFLPVYANGFPVVIFVYEDIPILHFKSSKLFPDSRLVVAGQIKDEDVQMEIKGNFGQIGVILNPTSTYYLFHKSGKYFCNRWKNFMEASPLPVQNLVNDLVKGKGIEEHISQLFQILEHLHQCKLPSIAWLDTSVQSILQNDGMISQKELAQKANISIRQFRRKFNKVIGVSPKYFSKLIQLNTTIELLQSSNFEKLKYLALDCGYYDQAHFTNDFKKFIGTSPKDFLNGEHEFIHTYLGR